ncbi:MAG: trypsin-like peptidase domain-containing protein [Arachidicoccus sp.]|nr:trypsin-like peptidase domain-containing protein [Arachidicoccus sp.]
MKFKSALLVVFISAATALGSVWCFAKYEEYKYAGVQEEGKLPVNYASFYGKQNAADNSIDFTSAASSATPAVVHIKIQTKAKTVQNPNYNGDDDSDPFGQLFGQLFNQPKTYQIPSQRASGSGVIVTDDGYIVTNNHVVQDADKITVTTSDKKVYTARVIGTDPGSDLAVIKIDTKGLPYLVYGNSDNVKLGQWVLAIGYPFTLDVTVTAGIVSAKARDIGIGRQNAQGNSSNSIIESYLQTDAAVNPGNSGGALINTNGELIGINSAIASPTGSYSGYSFAIPVNIVKKVAADIIKYGAVQRGYMGLSFMDLSIATNKYKSQYNVKDYNSGLYVTDVAKDGAAAAAGIKSGDIITKINGLSILSSGELSSVMGDKKPGDKLSVTYLRAGKENTSTITLKNSLGDLSSLTAKDLANKSLGANLTTISPQEASQNGLRGGVKVTGIQGGAFQKAGVKEGFIIIDANNTMIKTADQLNKLIQSSNGSVFIHGIYPNGEHIYGYRLDLGNSNGDNNNTPNNGDDDDDDDGN